jgi:hypothetical protein
MNNDRAFIGVEDRRSLARNADITIQGFPLVESAEFASRGRRTSRSDELLKAKSRDCANEVKKLAFAIK